MTEAPEPLAVLLLPRRLEDFEFAEHARDLLSIPRVVALEPPRGGRSGSLREAVSALQARRLRFPGDPRVIVLYRPRQYPLARALLGVHENSELWYVPPDPSVFRTAADRSDDESARARAARVLIASPEGDPRAENEPLRSRLTELGVISHHSFVPGAHVGPSRTPGEDGIPRLGWGWRPGSGRRQFS
ncbi:MAG TPA: hypothetical protein VMB27_20550 [Solirubrobacteraceae bacterium]|nr:hypothetical protein [Solirubrobacteraceae bacterium]